MATLLSFRSCPTTAYLFLSSLLYVVIDCLQSLRRKKPCQLVFFVETSMTRSRAKFHQSLLTLVELAISGLPVTYLSAVRRRDLFQSNILLFGKEFDDQIEFEPYCFTGKSLLQNKLADEISVDLLLIERGLFEFTNDPVVHLCSRVGPGKKFPDDSQVVLRCRWQVHFQQRHKVHRATDIAYTIVSSPRMIRRANNASGVIAQWAANVGTWSVSFCTSATNGLRIAF
jgi:hypothetical protein